ncbi:uncharacterized protein [Nicotiana tomentosiformis]|uniref:uncharacterized protein n=1 Tax=Nicotiana tomentosiformis TaxID=4098 RepID=UPI00388CB0AA
MGDFNAILNLEDRVHSIEVHDAEIRDFRKFMVEAGMTELQTIGRSYTRRNNHTYSRIDRAIVNSNWMTTMPHLLVQVIDPIFLDHSPLCIELDRLENRCRKAFIFMNCIAKHLNFTKVVEDNWRQTNNAHYMKDIWEKLKHVKNAIKELNVKEFNWVTERIKDIRGKLKNVQEDMRTPNHSQELFEAEKELRIQLEKWDLIEESIYKQKSSVQWLKLGESNSAYFFASMKNRRAQNHINDLVSTKGRMLQTEKGIEEEILKFYKQLLGNANTTLPAIRPNIMNTGPILNRRQKQALIRPFDKEEVSKAL